MTATEETKTVPLTILGFTPETEEALTSYPWPGNIRELRNTVERAVILGSGERIGTDDLPENIGPSARTPAVGDRVPLSTIEELHIRRVIANTSSLQEAADVLGIDQATPCRQLSPSCGTQEGDTIRRKVRRVP